MSGDVQPRKRKDKKRKKDELGLEEPRGTAAALGEGDVFMHSPHDHGTGGHWCAKIIFFSLLAILITLIGLIILENRGLSELEANSVESRYSGVLEGWLEDAPDDDHHDEHTLELTHHDDEEDHDDVDHLSDNGHDDEEDEHDDEHDEVDEHAEEDEEENADDGEDHDEDDEIADEDDDEHLKQGDEPDQDEDNYENDNNYDQTNEDSQEDDNGNQQHQEDDEDEPHRETFEEDDDETNEDNNDLLEEDEDDNENSIENNYEIENYENSNEDDKNQSEENEKNEDDDEHEEEEEDEEDDEVEVEKLEKEVSEEEPISVELPALPEADDDDDDKNDDASDDKDEPDADEDSGIADNDDDEEEEFLEADDDSDEPPIEHITVPAGKPFVEVEEKDSSEQPPDTLAEEEEYEKRQEKLRKEEAQSSHMWLKLTIGGALLVATHAVVRRATRSRDEPETEEHASREETPVIDRRMTLLPEQHSVPARKVIEEISQPVIEKVIQKAAPIVKAAPIISQDSEEEEEEDEEKQVSEDEEVAVEKPTDDKELYSEEDEPAEEVEEEEEEEIVVQKTEVPKQAAPVEKKPEPESEEEIEEDVEIIGDEQLEEEEEEDEDEEEISDVDDAELLNRLEAKYGRLPEPERPGRRQKDGGNSVNDAWPGEPSDAYWRQQLDSAERELRQGAWSSASDRASSPQLRDSARARYIVARAFDAAAEARRDNRLLSRAISAYLDLLKMNERLSDKKLIEVANRTLDRIHFRGNYLNAEPVYRLLIRRFPNEPSYRNNLTISFLMANRADLAEEVLKETLKRWPDDRIALAHYGFVLKTKHNQFEKAVELFKKALEGDTGPANEARFYYHYGDSLLLLGRPDEAHEVHKRGAKLGHFLSPSQRSLYNVPRLKSSPWWNIEDTPYLRLAKALEKSWKEILKEGEAARALYEQEKEGLKERGEWSQLDLFVRGQEIPGRCDRAPVTCAIIRSEPAAAGCRRGQVKFSSMAPGTHVRAHVGPTNCRLRMHLGLSNTKDTYIRVDKEIRQWQAGKVLMFDDSFEHEVWHNGTGARLVLIADVWHPQLTPKERRALPAI